MINVSSKKFDYIYFFLFKRKRDMLLNFTSNFEVLGLNKDILMPNFTKLIANTPIFATSVLGKTVELRTLSEINEFSINCFLKRNFFLDSFLRVGSDLTKFFFINKKKLDTLSKGSFYLFVGTELRAEEPLLNLILRRNFMEKGGNFFSIGSRLSSNFFIRHIGSTVSSLADFIFGNHWCANLYYKSVSSFFIFGKSFFSANNNLNLFYKLVSVGMGSRMNDIVFFSGYVSSYISAALLGLNNFSYKINQVLCSPLMFSFCYGSTFFYAAERSDSFSFFFDHNFTSLNRQFADLIIPQHNFAERNNSLHINCFNEVKRVSGCLIKDVEGLFEMSYKKSFDSLVYDSKIFNFGKIRSAIVGRRVNTNTSVRLKLAQISPALFFSYEHIYNVLDSLLFEKLLVESRILQRFWLNDFYNIFSSKFNLNNSLLFVNKSFDNDIICNFQSNLYSNNILVNNKLYFDPENDTLSNSSVLLLKTYKRVVLQLTNFN
jgi:hypothetical protein